MAGDEFTSPGRRLVYALLLVPVLIVVTVVALRAVPGSPWHERPRLGLDLQGGVEVVLKAVPAPGQKLSDLDVERALLVMRNRLDRLGVAELDIRKQGRDEIVIQLAGVRDPATAARIVGEPAQLEVYDLEPSLIAGPASSLYGLLSHLPKRYARAEPAEWYLFGPSHALVAGPAPTRAALLAKPRAQALRARGRSGARILAVPARTVVLGCTPGLCPRGTLYLFRRDPSRGIPQLTGADFKGSNVADFDPEAPVVPVELTRSGARKYARLSRAEAQRGRARGKDQHAAVVLDRTIQAVLTLDYRKYPHGIAGTGIEISGGSIRDLANIALVLHSGSLPAAFQELQRTEVSATLGRDSLHAARTAAVLGLVLVAIFLLVLYRFLGFVAVLGLLVYAAFLYGLVLHFHITLTLAGFAGLILTIGLAADANVVIFERIKDEVRRGKRVRNAVGSGYTKGFRTIVDAHVVTAITALVLFAVSSAGVRGFALMLLFGTVVSLFTAVVATRALLGVLAGFEWFDNATFMGAAGRQRLGFLDIDFVGRRRLWFAISGAMVVVSAVSLAVRGLDFGIDFRSGSQLTFATVELHGTEDVRSVARRVGRGDSVIQGRGSAVDGKYRSWQLRTRDLSPGELTHLEAELRDRVGARSFGVAIVSASFARHLIRQTAWAILVSLVLIFLYVMWRFDFKFAVPVLVTLVHDVVVTAGAYSLSGREVNAATVAAVLTVLGYSIYDTVIVFDRVRDNMTLLPRSSFATIANVSLRQTIRRSLATTFVTILPVTSLLAIGGATLSDFAFAILIGVVAGAYSSIFIAAPLLVVLKGPETYVVPKHRGRVVRAPAPGPLPDERLPAGQNRP